MPFQPNRRLPNLIYQTRARMEQYLYHLDTARSELPSSVKYLAVDGAYAKENFITGAMHLQLHVISKLRTRRESALALYG